MGNPPAAPTERCAFLSVVVPCHNEAANLEELHRGLAATLPEVARTWQIVLVDDGSTDGTERIGLELAARDPYVQFLSFSRNFGKEAAMLAGLEHARGDAVVLMDGDLQHPVAMIPALVRRHLDGYDQVIARRDRRADPRLRTALSRVFYRLVNPLIDVPLDDGAGDFRLLSRRAVDALVALRETNRFSKGLYSWIGFPTAVLDYTNVRRDAGRSSWTLHKLLDYAIDGILSFNTKPLRVAIWIGLWMVGLMLAYVVWLVVGVAAFGVQTPGYVTTVAAVVLLAGVQLIVTGVIGEYVGRIYSEVKRRPAYLLRVDTAEAAAGLPGAAVRGAGVPGTTDAFRAGPSLPADGA
ncbi:glycosyltransferase family 2 protein [Raineyella sp. LH-20]|uniref:glycosyltransferase family 2 protein n=1 Tax=Raineyella sp. LH-20 TaxID=3081204 RepID=UPI0029558BE1|nr:glycosyltransferase family 2 protein [Raineyella sp. LH-20]WOP19837.1 glycosyltransferase family 2 protein [Raineyella sp. LH-20]